MTKPKPSIDSEGVKAKIVGRGSDPPLVPLALRSGLLPEISSPEAWGFTIFPLQKIEKGA